MMVRLSELRFKAAAKPNGYLSAWIGSGETVGPYLKLSRADYVRLKHEWRGWGDKIHDFLRPAVLWWDKRFGTNLANCSACQRRAELFNKLGTILTRPALPDEQRPSP